MKNLGEELGINISVHGPETFITAVVPIALGTKSNIQRTSSRSQFGELVGSSSTTDDLASHLEGVPQTPLENGAQVNAEIKQYQGYFFFFFFFFPSSSYYSYYNTTMITNF